MDFDRSVTGDSCLTLSHACIHRHTRTYKLESYIHFREIAVTPDLSQAAHTPGDGRMDRKREEERYLHTLWVVLWSWWYCVMLWNITVPMCLIQSAANDLELLSAYRAYDAFTSSYRSVGNQEQPRRNNISLPSCLKHLPLDEKTQSVCKLVEKMAANLPSLKVQC